MPDDEQRATSVDQAPEPNIEQEIDTAIDELRDTVAGTIEPGERANVYSVPAVGGAPQTRGGADGDGAILGDEEIGRARDRLTGGPFAPEAEYRDAPAVERRPMLDRLTTQSINEGVASLREPVGHVPGPGPVPVPESDPPREQSPPMSPDRPPDETLALADPLPATLLQDIARTGISGTMSMPYLDAENNTDSGYDSYCYCHPCQLTRNYRRLVYAYEAQESDSAAGNGDILPREAYRYARRRADRLMGEWRCDIGATRSDREAWDSEFQHLYARWARNHAMLGYPEGNQADYRIQYSESGSRLSGERDDMAFVATPTGYEPPVEINFASAVLNQQVSTYERQVTQAKATIGMAAGELKGGRLALKGLYVQQSNAAKAVKNSDDLLDICKGMPEIIGVRYGPCSLPGGETLQRGEVEVLFLPVLYGRSTSNGTQKRLTTPVSFRITADGRVYGAGRTNYHPHLRSEGICLGYMGATRGYGRGASVELILTKLAGVNDIGGMLKLMSAWRLGHNPRDELNHDWRWHGVRDFFDADLQRNMWPEWDGKTVQYAPRGVIGPLDRWLPGIFDVAKLSRTEIGKAIYLMWRDTRNLSPHLDPYLISRLKDLNKRPCRTCYEPAIKLVNRYSREAACLGCTKKEGQCECPANRFKVSRHLVRYFPQDNVMFYPVRPPEESNPSRYRSSQLKEFWWCAGQHADYRGNYKYTARQCGNGPTLSANPLYGMAWLQCGTWSTNPWQFKAQYAQEMRCTNHSIGSMRGERGELSING